MSCFVFSEGPRSKIKRHNSLNQVGRYMDEALGALSRTIGFPNMVCAKHVNTPAAFQRSGRGGSNNNKKPLKCSHCIVCFPLLEIVAEQSPRPLAKLLESLAVTWTSYCELCLYILRRGLTFCTKTEPTAAERTRQNVDNRKPCVVRVYVHLQSARCLFIYFHIRPSSA